jgi:hypothetical protein
MDEPRWMGVLGSVLLVLCLLLGAAVLGIIAAKYVTGLWALPW